mgnify:CR=1 FL=1
MAPAMVLLSIIGAPIVWLLDRSGKVAAKSGQLGKADPALVKATRQVVQAA